MFSFTNIYLFFYYVSFNFFMLSYINSTTWLSNLSFIFIVLTTYLSFICILILKNQNLKKENFCFHFIFILYNILIGLFWTSNLLVFYIFYESALIPLFIIIIIYGSRLEKIRAAYFLFFFTLIASLGILFSLLKIYNLTGTFHMETLFTYHLPFYLQKWIYLSLSLGFLVKIPLFPFHIWLPQAHVEAPLIGSILLAGIMLKLGAFGLLRIAIPLCPSAYEYYSPFFLFLSICNIIYGGCITFRQSDMKRLIAYSSVAHMGFASYALFNPSCIELSLASTICILVAHGLSSPGLFTIVGLLYDRYHTRIIKYYGGCKTIHPFISEFAFLFTLASIAFPGSLNFIGEIICILGAVNYCFFQSLILGLGALIGLVYALHFYQKIFTGTLSSYLYGARPVNKIEVFVLNLYFWPLLILGLAPFIILKSILL